MWWAEQTAQGHYRPEPGGAAPDDVQHDLLHCENPDERAIVESVNQIVREVQAYVPGYSLRVPPIVDGNKVTVIVQVEGLEIFCPNTPETSISSTLPR